MTETDAQLARRIAESAGEILVTVQRSRLFEDKALGKVGDRVANAFIMEALARHRPDDAVLSEEEKADPARLARERVWIVDPLDGTREYGERRTDWAVHVALTEHGRPVAGAVALPGVPEILDTDAPPASSRARAEVPCAWWSAARDRPPRRSPSPSAWAPNSSAWVRPGPRR